MLISLLAFASAAAQEQIFLEAPSDQGTFIIKIAWTPDDIGRKNSFEIHFVEPETREEIEDVLYDISVYRAGEREILLRDQTAILQEFTFDEPGSYEIRIDDIENLGERVIIPIQVTPEFQLGGPSIAVAAFGVAVIAMILNSKSLFSQLTK
jgi:hypothetical protein